MKVKEMIEKLQEFDPEYEVVIMEYGIFNNYEEDIDEIWCDNLSNMVKIARLSPELINHKPS